MTADVATLQIRVESLEAELAERRLRGMTAAGVQAERTMGGMTRTMGGMAKTVGAVAAALGAVKFASDAAKNVREFNYSIASLSAITGAVGKDLETLRTAAFNFGRTTTLSASQAAEGMMLVASAKPDLLESAAGLAEVTRNAIALAEAAGATLPQAAATLGSALNMFGAGAEEAARFTNVMAAGAKYGASMVHETAEALKYAGSIASGAGLSFEQTNAAIQQLSTVAIKGSEAGTGLRMMLLRLETQTEARFKPSVVGFSQALHNLKDAGMGPTEMLKLFDARTINVARNVINGADSIDVLTGKMTGSNIAYEQQATKVNTLDGAIKGLKSAYEGLTISIGQDFEGPAISILRTMTDIINASVDMKAALQEESGGPGPGGVGVTDWLLDDLAYGYQMTKTIGKDIFDEAASWAAAVASIDFDVNFTPEGQMLEVDLSGAQAVLNARTEHKALVWDELRIFKEKLIYGAEAGRMLDEQLTKQRALNSAAMAGQTDIAPKSTGPNFEEIMARRAKTYGITMGEMRAAMKTFEDSGLSTAEAHREVLDVLIQLDSQTNQNFRPAVVGLGQALKNVGDAAAAQGIELGALGQAGELAGAGIAQVSAEMSAVDAYAEAGARGVSAFVDANRAQAAATAANVDGLTALGAAAGAASEVLIGNAAAITEAANSAEAGAAREKESFDEIKRAREAEMADAQKALDEIKARHLTAVEAAQVRADEEIAALGQIATMDEAQANERMATEKRIRDGLAAFIAEENQKAIEEAQRVADKKLADEQAYENEMFNLRIMAADNVVDAERIKWEQQEQAIRSRGRAQGASEEAINAAIEQQRAEHLERLGELETSEAEKAFAKENERRAKDWEWRQAGAESELEAENLRWERRVEEIERRGAFEKRSQEEIDAAIEAENRRHQTELDQITVNGERKREAARQKIREQGARGAMNTLTQMTAGVAQHSRAMFNINKVAAMASAAMNIPEAASDAYKQGTKFGGPALGAAFAAVAVAAEMAQLQAIKSTTFEGGGGGTTPSLSGSVPTVNGTPYGGEGSVSAGAAQSAYSAQYNSGQSQPPAAQQIEIVYPLNPEQVTTASTIYGGPQPGQNQPQDAPQQPTAREWLLGASRYWEPPETLPRAQDAFNDPDERRERFEAYRARNEGNSLLRQMVGFMAEENQRAAFAETAEQTVELVDDPELRRLRFEQYRAQHQNAGLLKQVIGFLWTEQHGGELVDKPQQQPVNPDALVPPTQSTPQLDGELNRTTIIVTGNVGFTPAIIDEIAEGLRQATGERDVVIFDENSRQAQDLVSIQHG